MTRTSQAAAIWLGTVVLAIGFCFHVFFGLKDSRKSPPNFWSMDNTDRVSVYGMTRTQQHQMKIGFAEQFPAPQVGLIGNHQAGFFGKEAFGKQGEQAQYFYNYFLGNLSLTENLDVLQHLAKIKKLPSKLIIFQLTTPNNDNGQYIIHYNQELPPDLIDNASDASVSPEQWWFDSMGRWGALKWHYTYVWRPTIDRALNYTSFFVSAFNQFNGDRIFDARVCLEANRDKFKGSRFSSRQASFEGAEIKLNQVERTFASSFCTPDYLLGAFKSDGTWDADFYVRTVLKQNENELKESERFLKPGDEILIAKLMKRVDDLAKENGTDVVFLVPPVHETERYSSVDQVLSAAFAKLPEIKILDHRKKYREAEYFFNYDHPKENYYVEVVRELRERGWLKE